MTAYACLRLVHSYWRWTVLAAGMVTLLRSLAGVRQRRDWTRADDRASRLFVAAVDIQVLLGLILYFGFSPFWTATHESFRLMLKDRTTRFFGIEHETAMLLAFVVAHLGRVRVRRASDGPAKHRAVLVMLACFFALVLWAIPWPWRAVGRPLLRLSP